MEAIFKNNLNLDWAIFVYILSLSMVLAAKKNSGYKFFFFSRLLFTNTYIKTYKDGSLIKPFHVLITSSMLIIFPLLLQALLFRLEQLHEILLVDYFKIGGGFVGFVVLKTVLQIVFGILVGKKKDIKRYLFEKQTYLAYLIFVSLLPLLFLLFSPETAVFSVYSFVFVWVVLFVLATLLIIFHFKELILEHPLYFILYLCAFEICPIISAFYIIK